VKLILPEGASLRPSVPTDDGYRKDNHARSRILGRNAIPTGARSLGMHSLTGHADVSHPCLPSWLYGTAAAESLYRHDRDQALPHHPLSIPTTINNYIFCRQTPFFRRFCKKCPSRRTIYCRTYIFLSISVPHSHAYVNRDQWHPKTYTPTGQERHNGKHKLANTRKSQPFFDPSQR
jgi:hypothetical protein